MLRKYTAVFEVEVWYDNDPHIECGFYPADTFGEAMDYIEKYFGDELVAVKHLELIDVGMVTMDREIMQNLLAKC